MRKRRYCEYSVVVRRRGMPDLRVIRSVEAETGRINVSSGSVNRTGLNRIDESNRSLVHTAESGARRAAFQGSFISRKLLAVFAGLSLVLSVIGIDGVMAHAVSQRTRELGLRMALGASRGDVLRLVVMQGLRLTLMGVAFGLAASLAVTRVIASLLYGVSPTDVVTFTVVPLLLASAALVASYVGALRATRIDPMVALRYE